MMQEEVLLNRQKTRVGINPARGKVSSYKPADITVAVLTYIPSLEGYFENRLDVLKLALASLKRHTSVPHDFYVFDNGSCPQVVEFLKLQQQEGLVDMLMLSTQNIGKIGALKILFNSAPGKFIAYSDDDIFFYPGWLEAHIDVIHHFPGAGMVSGLPVRDASGHANMSLEKLAGNQGNGIEVEYKRHIPDEWEIDWALSTGRDPEKHLNLTRNQLDAVIRAKKVDGEGRIEAVASANHFQFVAPKPVMMQALPKEWTGNLMGSMIELDEAVDRLGYLRLSTAGRYTRHIGNVISDELVQEAARLAIDLSSNLPRRVSIYNSRIQRKHWILRIPGSRKLLHTAYRRLFDILFK